MTRVADFDLMWCEKYLVAYIELMTPPQKDGFDAWAHIQSREFEGNFNFIDISGRALATAIIISYSRPWSGNKGIDGKRGNSIELFEHLKNDYEEYFNDEFDEELHRRIVRVRNSVVAHSDLQYWGFQVFESDRTVEREIDDPFRYLSLIDARNLLSNTKILREALESFRRAEVKF